MIERRDVVAMLQFNSSWSMVWSCFNNRENDLVKRYRYELKNVESSGISMITW